MKHLFIAIVACWMMCLNGRAQEPQAGDVELFSGAELNYRDVNFMRLYDVLINLTPGLKWHLGKEWMVSAQATVPVVSDGYEPKHNLPRLTNAAVAKQLHLGPVHLKATGGLFGLDRYGVDLRAMVPLTSWLLFQAQAGYTGYYRLATGRATYRRGVIVDETKAVEFGAVDRFTGVAGFNVWLEPWKTEFRLSGGRYVNEDYGGQIEVMRHFKHCTVGIYGQLHQRKHSKYREAGGFKVVVMIPQWTWHLGKLRVRPASNFRLTYNAQADGLSMKMYTTDPEENERIYPVRVNWGLERQ